MGRIKSLMIKKAAKQLIQGEHRFNDKFDNNKKILASNMPSKPIRNKIAGYITRLIRMQNDAVAREERRLAKIQQAQPVIEVQG